MSNIPRLRFSGFEGEWDETTLGEVTVSGEYGMNTAACQYDGINKYLRITDIDEKNRSLLSSNLTSPNGKLEDKYLLEEGDIVFARTGASVGKSYIYDPNDGKVYFAGFLIRFRVNTKTTSAKYVFYQSLTRSYHKWVVSVSARSGQPGINAQEYRTFSFFLPSLPEQQKIASFLESVDSWIDNLKNQKESLEEYKKGMMQKIFAQEIRFKDENGKDFPDWEEKKLGEVIKERKEYSVKEKGYPHISLTTQGVVPKSARYNRDFLVGDDEVKKYRVTHLNDLCYNPANLKFGVIAINKLVSGIFSPIYVTFEIINQDIDFIGYYLTRNEFINKARRYEQGTVYERMAVSPADFIKVKVAFPSLPEQQKISSFLSSLDDQIQLKTQQIEKAEQWKKGLMQGLFI